MQKILKGLMLVSLVSFLAPGFCLAANPVAKQKAIIGTVTKAYENILVVKTSSAALYTAQTWEAKLVRRYGSIMEFKEILVGDKVEVKGLVWPDNSINASLVRNISLYPHNITLSGKIESLDPYNSSFSLRNSSLGLLNVYSDSLTIFKRNSSNSGLLELEPGISVSVKGVWERDRSKIVAKQVLATVRLVSVDITGTLSMVSPSGLTVIASGNVIYGVNILGAKLQDKNRKTIYISQFTPGQSVKVTGKHISGKSQIIANTVKNLSLQ